MSTDNTPEVNDQPQEFGIFVCAFSPEPQIPLTIDLPERPAGHDPYEYAMGLGHFLIRWAAVVTMICSILAPGFMFDPLVITPLLYTAILFRHFPSWKYWKAHWAYRKEATIVCRSSAEPYREYWFDVSAIDQGMAVQRFGKIGWINDVLRIRLLNGNVLMAFHGNPNVATFIQNGEIDSPRCRFPDLTYTLSGELELGKEVIVEIPADDDDDSSDGSPDEALEIREPERKPGWGTSWGIPMPRPA